MEKVFSLPRGTADILPADISTWQNIEAVARKILNNYNYQEIRTPLFEDTDLFARSMGQTSDVVQKQMLNLASQNPDENGFPKLSGLSLRPENTASVVRSYIQNHFDRKESLSKFFYIGPMFRGERPQKGRLRQFHQIGVEAIGPESCSPYLDAEVIALSVSILKLLGLKTFELKINTLGTEDDKKNFSVLLRNELSSKVGLLCDDCRSRIDRNVFRVIDCKERSCRKVVNELDIGHSYLSEESADYFKKVKEALDLLEIKYSVCLNLVRGLDYYTHTVFEITASSLGSQDALGAGGRYNGLVNQLGGPKVDAVGFALGMERILLAMPEKTSDYQKGLDTFIVSENSSFSSAFKLMNSLREKAISCDISYRSSSMKSQMRLANKLNARSVIFLGERELENEIVTIKDMKEGGQEEISIKDNDLKLLISNILERYK